MTEHRDVPPETADEALESTFRADPDLSIDAAVGAMRADADIEDTPPPEPPPALKQYNDKIVPRGELTAQARIIEARKALQSLSSEETTRRLSPEMLQERLGFDNLKNFVKEALVSFKEGRRMSDDVMNAMLSHANADEELNKAAKIPGVANPETERVKVTRETLDELAKRIQEWANESITLQIEQEEKQERQRDSSKKWYKRGWVKKTGLIMAVGAGAPLIATATMPAALVAAGWASWSGIAAVAGIRVGDAAKHHWGRSRREGKIRKEKITAMEASDPVKGQMTHEALSFVSARMRENAEKHPEEEQLTRARSEYAARLSKGLPAVKEKAAYDAALGSYFNKREGKILTHLGARPNVDLDLPENEELKEHVLAIMALAKADERNRLVEAQTDALVGDGKSFPGFVGKVYGAVREGVGAVSKGLGVARTEYRLGYAVAMTTGAVLAKATEMRHVWGAAIGAMGGSALTEAAVASRLNKKSSSVIEVSDLIPVVQDIQRTKAEALALFSPTATLDATALGAVIVKVRSQVDSAAVYRKLGKNLRDAQAVTQLQELERAQSELRDLLVALQGMQNVYAFDETGISDTAKGLAEEQRKETSSRKNKIFAARVGGAIAGGALGFFASDAIKSSLAWAKDHMPFVDHDPVVPAATTAPATPSGDPPRMSLPGAADPSALSGAASAGDPPRMDPDAVTPSSAPDIAHSGDVASTTAGSPSHEVLQDAVVHKGQGVEHALIRQLVHDPATHGYDGDTNDTAAVKSWAGKEAHRIALDSRNAYVTENAETRVRFADKYAYVLNNDGTVSEYEVKPAGSGEFTLVGQSGVAQTLDKYEYSVPRGTVETVHAPHVHAPDTDVDAPDAGVSADVVAGAIAPEIPAADQEALRALLAALHTAQDSGDTASVASAQSAIAEFGESHPDTLFDATTQTTTEAGEAAQNDAMQKLSAMFSEGSGKIQNVQEFHDGLVNVFKTIMPDADAQQLALMIGETDPDTHNVYMDASDVAPLMNHEGNGFDIDQFTHMKDQFYAELNQHSLPADGEWHPRHPMGLEATSASPDRTDDILLIRREPGSAGTYEMFDSALRHTGGIDPYPLEVMLKPLEDVASDASTDVGVSATDASTPAMTPEPAAEAEASADAEEDKAVPEPPVEPADVPPVTVSSEPIIGDTSHEKVLSATDDTDASGTTESPTASAEETAVEDVSKSEYADLLARPSTEIPDNVHISVNPDAHTYMQEHGIQIDVEAGRVVVEHTGGLEHTLAVPSGEHELHFEIIDNKLYAIGENGGMFNANYIDPDGNTEIRGMGQVDKLADFRAGESAYHEREAEAVTQNRTKEATELAAASKAPEPMKISPELLPFMMENANTALDYVQKGLTMEAIQSETDVTKLSAVHDRIAAFIADLDSRPDPKAVPLANILRFAQEAVDRRLETLEASTLRPAA